MHIIGERYRPLRRPLDLDFWKSNALYTQGVWKRYPPPGSYVENALVMKLRYFWPRNFNGTGLSVIWDRIMQMQKRGISRIHKFLIARPCSLDLQNSSCTRYVRKPYPDVGTPWKQNSFTSILMPKFPSNQRVSVIPVNVRMFQSGAPRCPHLPDNVWASRHLSQSLLMSIIDSFVSIYIWYIRCCGLPKWFDKADSPIIIILALVLLAN